MPVPRTQLSPTLMDLYDYIDLAAVQTDAVIASGAAVSLTSTTTANITSLVLQPGKYDIFGFVGFLPAASTSITRLSGGESETSATAQPSGQGFALSMSAVVPGAVAQELPLPFRRSITFLVQTTIYLVATATFTVSTLGAYGTLSAVKLK